MYDEWRSLGEEHTNWHGPQKFQVVMAAWLAALFQTFIVVEPTIIGGIVMFPSIANHPAIAKCINCLKEYGFI